MRKEKSHRIDKGEVLYVEGKHGIVEIRVYSDYVTVIVDAKTDTRRQEMPS